MHALLQHLSLPQTYIDEIQNMHEKARIAGTLFSDTQNDVAFYAFSLQRNKVAKLLAKSIKNETFQYGVASESWVSIGTKMKLMTRQSIIDRVVHGAIFSFLTHHAEGVYSESLGSYRQGQSVYTVANEIRQFFKQHQQCSSNHHVDLYVLRTDIQQYANKVPLTDDSPLWEMIHNFLAKIDPEAMITPYLDYLIKHTINPVTQSLQGETGQRAMGVPYGTKMAGFVYNFYINSIDHTMNNVPGLFYQRYCDDTIIIHQDPNVILQINQQFDQSLHSLKLNLNTEKTQLAYLTLNGKPCTQHPEFINTTQIDFLGFSIQANGTLRLKRRHTRRIMKSLRKRIQAAAYLTKTSDIDIRGMVICNAIKNAFSRSHSVKLPKYLSLIEFHDDRQQLKQLDNQIALWASQAITGIHNKTSLRHVPHKMLIDRWQLPSLCHLRNKGAGH